jgi:hypothetical protein
MNENEKVKFFDELEFFGTNSCFSMTEKEIEGVGKLTWSATSSSFDNNSALVIFERKIKLTSAVSD